jgi:DNA-binding MarR family transcriptional regulator
VLLDLYVAFQVTGRLIDLELATTGIPTDDYALYTALAHRDQRTPTDLSRELGLALSTVIFRTGRMIERGHAMRVPNPRDRRSVLLALTPRGRRLADQARPMFSRVLERVERHLDRPLTEVQEAVATLSRALADALAEAQDEELLRVRAAS